MSAPIIVALTDDYVFAVTVHLAQRRAQPITEANVRAALEAAAVTTKQAEPQPDLFEVES